MCGWKPLGQPLSGPGGNHPDGGPRPEHAVTLSQNELLEGMPLTCFVAIVEDDPLFRENLVELINESAGFRVSSAFASAEEMLEILPTLKPGLMLVDLGLPGMSGVELIREVTDQRPDITCAVHTMYEDHESVFSAIRAGAMGYLLKGEEPASIISGLASLRDGGSPMSAAIARAVIQDIQAGQENKAQLLTARERTVLAFMEKGHTYKEAASELQISVHTIHTHIKNIYEKLHVSNRQQAISRVKESNFPS